MTVRKLIVGLREVRSQKRAGIEKFLTLCFSTSVPEGCTVFVAALSDNASDDDVKSLFAQCGHVKTFRRIHEKQSKDFTGAGFIEFADRHAARQALRMNGYKFFTRKLRVEMAKQKTLR